jgi:hypothetical protein
MESKAAVCNLALSRVGVTQFIDDLDTDQSLEAEVCRRHYDNCLQQVLESAPWPFATRRYKPAPINPATLDYGAVPSGWGYAYPVPADAVSHSSVHSLWTGLRNPREDDKSELAVGYDGTSGNIILLCNENAPEFLYSVLVADPTKFTATFASCLAYRLAVELALALPKDRAKSRDMADAYQHELDQAWTTAQRGVQAGQDPDPDFIAARY